MITRENLSLLQSDMHENEAALILSDSNRFYLTGFKSSSGFCIITAQKLIFCTDFRYIEAALNGVKYFTVTEEKAGRLNFVKDILSEMGVKKLNVEAEFISVSFYISLKEKLDGIDVVADGCLDRRISRFRRVKTPEEIGLISKAASISDDAFNKLLERVRPGVTERELAAKLEYLIKRCGGDGIAFDTIAVTGANSSKPHGVPGDAIVKNGDFITFDFGAVYKGYLSDMTRTVAVGNITDEMKKVYDTVFKAQLASLKEIRIGAVCSEIDAVARSIITEAGYGNCFGHGLGHSLGIEIHESPSLSPSCGDELFENCIITCEPGIYIEGKFGVRIEDTVVVTKEGGIPLNNVTKELIII